MARYIDADLLLEDIEESVVFSVRKGVASPEIRGAYKIIDRIESAPTADVVEVETIKSWLYEMAINNVGHVIDGDFSAACEEIISRLDGLRNFARERSDA